MKRRPFIKCSSGVIALASHGTMFELFGQSGGAGALEKIFQNPPADAGLSIVYHWTGGVVTKEGITADMEGMAASGINTVNWFYFDASGVQDGVQVYPCKSPEWWDLVNHLIREAKRMGLAIAPHVCSSWGPSGVEFAAHVLKGYPKAKMNADWREMLEKEKSIDAVVISTPDHNHAPIAAAFMKEKKHIYVEKPMCKTIYEARKLAELAKQYEDHQPGSGEQAFPLRIPSRLVAVVAAKGPA